MALLFFAGAEAYSTEEIAGYGDGCFTYNNGVTVQGSVKRNGNFAFGHTFASKAHKLGLANNATVCLGFAYYIAGNGTTRQIAAIYDGNPLSTAEDTQAQIGISVLSDRTIRVKRGAGLYSFGGTTLATSTNILQANTWHFIEVLVTIHPSAGTVEVYVDGSKTGWIDITGQNTRNTANSYANGFGIGANDSVTTYHDDVYFADARMGDGRVREVPITTGDGTHADFTPSSASDNGAMVDEADPDGDTTYNQSTTPGNVDTYNVGTVGSTGAIKGLITRAVVKKVGTGVVGVQLVRRVAGTDYTDAAEHFLPSDAYVALGKFDVQSPATSVDFTEAELNASELGLEHAS